MKPMLFGLLLAGIFIMGCCGPITTSSGLCPYGTYGDACSKICEKDTGTEFDSGPDCFTTCIDMVKGQGLGDATTCCKQNVRQTCTTACQEQMDRMKRAYGSEVVEESGSVEEFMLACMGECTAFYEQIGVNIDTACNVIDVSSIHRLIED